MHGAKKVIIVGNGGIATELVHELDNIEVVWAVKDDAISSVFLDPGASQFLVKQVDKERTPEDGVPCKRSKYTVDSQLPIEKDMLGSALGPDWHQALSASSMGSQAGGGVLSTLILTNHLRFCVQVAYEESSSIIKKYFTFQNAFYVNISI